MVMSAIFSRKGMSRRHTTRKKRPRHTVFVCLFADIIQNHPPAHHIMPPKMKKKRGGGGGGGFTTTTAAAADEDDVNNDDVSEPSLSKKDFLAKIRADNAARANAAAAAAAVAPAGATVAADVSPYFASGAATTRASSLPRLSIFQRANDMGRKSAAPVTVSVPTELVAAAAAGRAEAEKAADDGESLDSVFDLPDDISFSGGGDMGDVENEGVEEDAGVEGSELAAITSVFNCDHINRKRMNDKDGWECSWCGKFFTPFHAARALKHVLKIKKEGIIACKALIPPRYLAWYTALSGYHSDRIESGKQTTHKIDLSVESTQLSAASSLLQKRGHDGGSSISSAAASALTGAPPLRH